MKRFFTLLMFLAGFSSLFAQGRYGRSILSVTNGSFENIKIQVDGKVYNMVGRNDDIVISNLYPGYHSIKIYKEDKRRNNGRLNFYNRYQLIFQKSVNLSKGYQLDFMVNRFGRVFMDEAIWDNNYYDDQQPNNHNDNWSNNNRQMDQQVFEQLKTTLQNESFDNSKLTMAKQAIGSNWVSTSQVKQLLELFSYEDNKLVLAKYAYPYTTDRNNYFLLYDGFTYSSSKEELAKFIRDYKD